MCWTDQILYLGNWYGPIGIQEPCGHTVVQYSHRCMRARLQIGGRLFGCNSSRYEWKGGKAFCVNREMVTHKVRGLCFTCHEGKVPWPTTAVEQQPHHNTYHHWSPKQVQVLQNDERTRAHRDLQAWNEKRLRQADKMLRARSGAGMTDRGERSLEDIRGQAVRRAATQRRENFHLPAVPALPIFHVSRDVTERHSAPVVPPRAPGRAPVSRRPVASFQQPRPNSDGTSLLRACDISLIPSPLSISKKRAEPSMMRRPRHSPAVHEGSSSSRCAPSFTITNAPALTIASLEDYVNGEFAGRVGGHGVVNPSQGGHSLFF